MSEASGVGVVVDSAAIPFLDITRSICAVLGVDPLGVVSSGCLVAALAPEAAEAAVHALSRANITAAVAGRFTSEEGCWMTTVGERAPLPAFERDEIARLQEALSRSDAASS
jgi:hydrogenase maturation factor